MADLSLNLDTAVKLTSAYGDLLIVNGDLTLTSDVDANGTNPVLQDILQNLRMFLGEWFLDNTQGVPWLQQIFVKGTTQADIDAAIQAAILSTTGVTALTSYGSQLNAASRSLAVTFSVKTQAGVVSYTGTLTPTQAGTV